MSRATMWVPRRHLASWNSDGKMIERYQRGHELYQVTEYQGIKVVTSHNFTDPIEAQHEWIGLQRSYLDDLEQRIPARLPARPGRTFDLTDIDDLVEGSQ